MVMLAANSMEAFRTTCVGNLIYRDLALIVNNRKLWEAFLNWSTLNHEKALAAVLGETLPYVDCTNTDGTVSGCFRPSKSDFIYLNKYDAQNAKGAKDDFKRPELLKDLERTILHELVHWGRHQTVTPQLKYSKINGKWIENGFGDTDAGKRFELDAYPSYYIPVTMPTTTKLSTFDE